MSHLTEAMRRAGRGIPLPATTASTSSAAETFPSESTTERPAEAAADFPPETVTAEPSRGARLREALEPAAARPMTEAEPQRIQSRDDGTAAKQTRSRTSKAPLAVFSGFNKTLVERMVVPEGAPHSMTEEYRRLAAALHHAQVAHGTKILMVTSASPGEGKTLTACNLALTLSQSYERRVLLMDADLRKPTVHELFAVQNAAGILDVLRDDPNRSERKVPLVEVSPRLQLLLSGGVTADPMSMLTSDSLRALLKDAAEVFDWVIVDTPPGAFLPDCNLLSSAVDAALLVVRAFVTPYPLVQRVVEAVGHDKIIGVVLNQAEQTTRAKYYGYGYGYGYGGYYGAIPQK
jgi:protein-tyrosine kinase